MSRQLFGNIGLLIGAFEESSLLRGEDLGQDSTIKDAFIEVRGGIITDFGTMSEFHQTDSQFINLRGATVLPGWCDSHSHIVYDGSREQEMVLRMQGASYAEIAAAGGGILNSAARLADATEDSLYAQAAMRLNEVMSMGTLAIEIKSGYGLSLESELKMLRVVARLKQDFPIPIKATFLGAHAFPMQYKEDRESYMRLLIDEMLPAIHAERLADFMDVFCDDGFFSVDQTERLLEAGAKYGLRPKIHSNELADIGGIAAAIKHNAISVDHLECMNDSSIIELAESRMIGTMLPGTSYFLGLEYAPARKLIKAGAAVALATDYNPGSTPSGRMAGVLSLACLKMKMMPLEAIHAATLQGAYAITEGDMLGSVTKGKRALFQVLTPGTTAAKIPYAYGSNLCESIIIDGRISALGSGHTRI